MSNNRSQFCATCGKARGVLEARRESWSIRPSTPMVPRKEDPSLRPWQITNDLIVSACVYRNGGCSEDTHLCDDCLRIGLRAIKLEVDRLLEVVEADHDKDCEIAVLSNRLGSLQNSYHNLQHDFDVFRRRKEPVGVA